MNNVNPNENLTFSHGEWVRKGEVAPSAFLREVNDRPGSRRYSGTLEELAELVKKNFSAQEPGVGAVDNDVLLITLPAEGFLTNIVPITEENAHLIEVMEPSSGGGGSGVSHGYPKQGAFPRLLCKGRCLSCRYSSAGFWTLHGCRVGDGGNFGAAFGACTDASEHHAAQLSP